MGPPSPPPELGGPPRVPAPQDRCRPHGTKPTFSETVHTCAVPDDLEWLILLQRPVSKYTNLFKKNPKAGRAGGRGPRAAV